MESSYVPRRMKRTVLIIVLILLVANIITAVSIISLVATQARIRPTSFSAGKDLFKHSLDKLYQDINVDFRSSVKMTLKRARAVPSLEFLSLLKPIVHISGLDFDKVSSENASRRTPIRNWALSEGSERTLMYNGMQYSNGSIIIPATGVYIVYSHLKFYVEDNKKNSKQLIFYHEVSKYNAATQTEENLLSNQATECKEGINEGAHLEYPSDVLGVVKLNAGDQLTVKVSDFNLLKHDRDWHYFGAYLV